MEDNAPLETEGPIEENNCVICNIPSVIEGHPTRLCADCRRKLINYPIPLWVKLFGAATLVLMIISLISLPGNFGAALAISRAIKAENHLNYVTEQRELESARKVAPNSVDVLGHLMIASFNNMDIETVFSASNDLSKKPIEDTALYNQLSYIIDESKLYIPSDSLYNITQRYGNKTIPDTVYIKYLKKKPSDIYSLYVLANSYYDKKQYLTADTLASKILSIDNEYMPAINLKSAVKREIMQTDSSIFYCDKILAINHESVYGTSSKARTFLKAGKFKQGLILAQQCENLANNDPYNIATLALAYHYNKEYQKRDKLLQTAIKDTTLQVYMKYAKDQIASHP
ncbi:hypothetical protein FFF34_009960 [Inquilinus sp. KBS0705]|nr:hypothetical protein FFF34_009960 [Inquilinus sp. KBS0705]